MLWERTARNLSGPWCRISGALLLVRVLTAGGSGAGGAARVPACCGRAPAAGPQRDGIPLCPAMPQFYIEAFRALIMIVASSGRYLAVSGHDHETGRAEGASLSSWQCVIAASMEH